MPELPEVESVRLALAERLPGRRVRDVSVLGPHCLAGIEPDAFAAAVQGRVFAGVGRRGKYLRLDFVGGAFCIVHLRMTGRLVAEPAEGPPPRHTHLLLQLDGGDRLRFSDVRKFGRWWWNQVPPGMAHLGPEPLDRSFTAAALGRALAGRNAPIKAVLLDQRTVAGLGNIYADEALFVAGLHPARRAGDLTEAEVRRLHHAVRTVLNEALHFGGTTFLDFRNGLDEPGAYFARLRVFRRSGLPCRRCGTPIERLRVGGRSSHYCPRCQGRGVACR